MIDSHEDPITVVQIAALFAVPRELAERFVRSRDFPAPVGSGGWLRAEVETWGRANGRLAGTR